MIACLDTGCPVRPLNRTAQLFGCARKHAPVSRHVRLVLPKLLVREIGLGFYWLRIGASGDCCACHSGTAMVKMRVSCRVALWGSTMSPYSDHPLLRMPVTVDGTGSYFLSSKSMKTTDCTTNGTRSTMYGADLCVTS